MGLGLKDAVRVGAVLGSPCNGALFRAWQSESGTAVSQCNSHVLGGIT